MRPAAKLCARRPSAQLLLACWLGTHAGAEMIQLSPGSASVAAPQVGDAQHRFILYFKMRGLCTTYVYSTVLRILQNEWPLFFQWRILLFQGQLHIISAFQHDQIQIQALAKLIPPNSRVTHRIVGQTQQQTNEENGHLNCNSVVVKIASFVHRPPVCVVPFLPELPSFLQQREETGIGFGTKSIIFSTKSIIFSTKFTMF